MLTCVVKFNVLIWSRLYCVKVKANIKLLYIVGCDIPDEELAAIKTPKAPQAPPAAPIPPFPVVANVGMTPPAESVPSSLEQEVMAETIAPSVADEAPSPQQGAH